MTKTGHTLRFRIEPQNGVTWVALSGNLTESADFGPLKDLRGAVVLDLSELGRINSLGARHWIHFVRDCEAAGVSLTLERCAPVFVSQISMISNFVGSRARVRSVFAPYVCLSCHHEHLELVEIPPVAPVHVETRLPCPQCRAPMELDELLQTYTGLFDRS